ncbi:LysR family transcriptional regulator [Oscillibacter sp. GMB15532]|uniref:LysR family transcriptional regulator n=1 Tax=Oscillibacter sp. GMB15532 TaxID=3230022 RepID=UPI0034DF167C
MDIKQLEFFVVACERGSLSQAAECLYTSQPNVSKTIRTLEHELGRPLLMRSGKGVQPTAYGKRVLEYAQLIIRTTITISSLALPDSRNSLCISAYPSNMIAHLLADFYREWGESCYIEHREGTVEEITDDVQQGISEVGIVYVAEKQAATFQHILSHKNLSFVVQDTKKICLYVGPRHPLYHAESVDFSDLSSLKFMRGVRDFFSMEHHLGHVSMGVIDTAALHNVVYTNSDHLNIALLLETDVCSLGLDFLHEPYAQYDIKALPINGCEPFLQVGYVQDAEHTLSTQAQWFVSYFQKLL